MWAKLGKVILLWPIHLRYVTFAAFNQSYHGWLAETWVVTHSLERSQRSTLILQFSLCEILNLHQLVCLDTRKYSFWQIVESLWISPLNNEGNELSCWSLCSWTKSLAINHLKNFLFFILGISFFDSKTLTLWPAWPFCHHETIYETNNIYFSTFKEHNWQLNYEASLLVIIILV